MTKETYRSRGNTPFLKVGIVTPVLRLQLQKASGNINKIKCPCGSVRGTASMFYPGLFLSSTHN